MLLCFLDDFSACPGSFWGHFRALWHSLGPLLQASWASLRDFGSFLDLLEPRWTSLGLLLGLSWLLKAYFGGSWAALGFPFAALLAQDAGKRQ